MIQNLYYLSGATSQSLFYEPGNNEATQTWDIDNLVVCSSLYQILAFSSSVLLASFPIEGTNLFDGYVSPSFITGSDAPFESTFPTPVIPTASPITIVDEPAPSVVQINYNFTTNVASSSFKIFSAASASVGQNYATASITLAAAFVDQTEARIEYDSTTYRFIAEAEPLNMDQPPLLYFFSTGSTANATATNLSAVINRALSGSLASSSLDVIYASGSGAVLVLSGSQSGSYANGITLSTGSSNNFSLQGTMGGGTNVTVSETASFVDLSTGGYGMININLGNELLIEVTGSNNGGLFYSSSLSVYNVSTQTSTLSTSSVNSNLSASFTASGLTYYTDVVASVNDLPYIQLTYSTQSGIPVTPTSSLENWNSYLGITASLVVNSGSTVYLIGEQISNALQLFISSSDSKLIGFEIYKGTNLTDFYLSDSTVLTYGLLNSFPDLSGSYQLQNIVINGTQLTSSTAPYLVNTNLQTLNVSNNKLSGSIQHILNTTPSQSIQTIDVSHNFLTGSVPVLSSSLNLSYFDCSYNQLSGGLASFEGCFSLIDFDCSNNALTGSIIGFGDLISIKNFNCSNNNITGSIPELSGSVLLETFTGNNNNLIGDIPNLSYNKYLEAIGLDYNYLTGSIPYLGDTPLQSFSVANNLLTDYVSGSISSSLVYFNAANNLLSQSAVDGIIIDIINSGATSGLLNLSGVGNATASAEVLASASAILTPNGWELQLTTAGVLKYAASGSGFDNIVYATALQSDGKVVVGGLFVSYSASPVNYITRLNSDGTIDNTFNQGTGFDGNPNDIIIQGDGKILVGGSFGNYNGSSMPYFIRLDESGSVDNTFNMGIGFDAPIVSITQQGDGKILVGGAFLNYSGSSYNRIIRLNSDGTIDTDFNVGTGTDSEAYSFVVQNDGKIIAGGSFTTYSGSASNSIIRINESGSVDTTFNVGAGFDSPVDALSIQNDGKIIAGGGFSTYSGSAAPFIVRLNSDGTIDNTFTVGTGPDNAVQDIKIQDNGKILIGGNFTTYDGSATGRIARLNTDGTLDTTFNQGIGFNSIVYTLTLDNDIAHAGGSFTSYNGTSSNRYAVIYTKYPY